MAKILCSGGCGHMGSWLVDYLVDKGHEVSVIDNLSRGKESNLECAIKKGAILHKIDLRSGAKIKKIIEDEKPEVLYVLHAHAAEIQSLFNPVYTTMVNYIGFLNLLVPAVNEGVETVVATTCHDAETCLVTNHGLLHWNEIEENLSLYPDLKVFTIKLETNEVEMDFIRKVVIYDYDGKMLRFKGIRHDLLVTPNHRMLLTKNQHEKPHLVFEEADSAYGRSSFKLPRPIEWKGGIAPESEMINIKAKGKKHWNSKKEPDSIPLEDLFYLIGIFVGDGVADIQMRVNETTGMKAEDYIKLKDEKGQFKKLNKPLTMKTETFSPRIRFCVPRKDKAREKLVKLLERLGYTPSLQNDVVQLTSLNLYPIFEECGKSAHDKHVPSWALQYAPKYLLKLYEGLMDSDGYTRNGFAILTTVSDRLLRDAIELGVKLGFSVKFYKQSGKACFKGRIIESLAYRIGFSQRDHSSYCQYNEQVEYHGKVWCLEVDNGNFLVERNGKLAFSGNSMAVYGDNPNLPFRETEPTNPEDPYGITKAATERLLYVYGKEFGFNWVVIRPHNVYGERQDIANPYRNVLGIWMNRIMHGKPPIIYGDGLQKRAFTYIDDCTKYIAESAFTPQAHGEIINIGSEDVTTLNSACEKVVEAMGTGIRPIHGPPRPAEVKEAYCSSDKARKILGYETTTSLRDGLRKMAAWAKKQGPQEFDYWEDSNWEINRNVPDVWRLRTL